MTVSKDLMANLILAAGGRGGISTGGGGSTNELTNWDGTKKNTGWEYKVKPHYQITGGCQNGKYLLNHIRKSRMWFNNFQIKGCVST